MRALFRVARFVKFAELGFAWEACALCGFQLQVRLRRNEIAARCTSCGASSITQSLVDVLRRVCGDLSAKDVYELSAAGPLVRWLRGHARQLTTSEYWDAIEPGQTLNGVQCQDVEKLTFDADMFDLCTSTEVFEHVENDAAAFREILRVLRPGGLHVFTVPLDTGRPTIERTEMRDGHRVNLLPPEYHADRYRGPHVLAYRSYGSDIAGRLVDAGFADIEFITPQRKLFGYARPVVVARKPAARNT